MPHHITIKRNAAMDVAIVETDMGVQRFDLSDVKSRGEILRKIVNWWCHVHGFKPHYSD